MYIVCYHWREMLLSLMVVVLSNSMISLGSLKKQKEALCKKISHFQHARTTVNDTFVGESC